MATCFVIMGFKQKTDLATGRLLDLDATYQSLIKPAVTSCQLECKRADEIPHSGIIDVPMYEQLLDADLVIADISTANINAIYELGVRHALRPQATIIIAEDKFNYPFDLNHILTLKYTHLGEDIGGKEITRFVPLLVNAIQAWKNQVQKSLGNALTIAPDSPVYTFLQGLNPPVRSGLPRLGPVASRGMSPPPSGPAGLEFQRDPVETLAEITDQAEKAIADSRFSDAKDLLTRALQRENQNKPNSQADHALPNGDPYLIQRLALATYKLKKPDEISALKEALNILAPLNLKDTNDPETLGIAGAIEKRLFDKAEGITHLENAIKYYQRGYILKNDYYNGINLAFLLDCRAGTAASPSSAEKIADHVSANRIRLNVLDICEKALRGFRDREKALSLSPGNESKINVIKNEVFWILATQAEAFYGLGQSASYLKTRDEAFNSQSPLTCPERYAALKEEASKMLRPKWMFESFEEQIEKLDNAISVNQSLFDKVK